MTNDHRVEGTKVVLSPTATQLPDGSIDTTGAVSEAPSVMIYELVDGDLHECMRISLEEARKLAPALLEVVDELDRWATT